MVLCQLPVASMLDVLALVHVYLLQYCNTRVLEYTCTGMDTSMDLLLPRTYLLARYWIYFNTWFGQAFEETLELVPKLDLRLRRD